MDKTINIDVNGNIATLHIMTLENTLNNISISPRPSILVCPGGGYSFVSDREGEPIARRFNSLGFNCFVLYYSINPVHFPIQLLQAARAMEYIRKNAKELNVDTNRVFTCGFSAGGHLVASLGAFYDSKYIKDAGMNPHDIRPDGQILCYPVITAEKEYCESYSYKSLLGEDSTQDDFYSVAPDRFVTPATPPTYFFHTADDNVVAIENTLLMCIELSKNKVPFESHIFKTGSHGLSLCDVTTATRPDEIRPEYASWPDMAANFLNSF